MRSRWMNIHRAEFPKAMAYRLRMFVGRMTRRERFAAFAGCVVIVTYLLSGFVLVKYGDGETYHLRAGRGAALISWGVKQPWPLRGMWLESKGLKIDVGGYGFLPVPYYERVSTRCGTWWEFDIPFWPIPACCVWYLLALRRRTIRRVEGACKACGYSLVGCVATGCPECGDGRAETVAPATDTHRPPGNSQTDQCQNCSPGRPD